MVSWRNWRAIICNDATVDSSLAKIAIGLIMVSVAAIAIKVALKTISNALEDKQADQSQATQQTTQSKIINLAIGLTSIFVGGLSLFIIA